MPLFRSPRVVLTALLLMGGLRSSEALQLGETEAQILARHGAPAVADHGRRLAMYSWAGWSVRLDFQGGKVAKLTYKKTDDFGSDDFASLLQANGGIAHWRETSQPGSKIRQWARDDGAVATFDTILATSMTIQSGEAATVLLQQAGTAAPNKVATVPAPAKPAPAPEFFPDPRAAVAKSDSKLSEITVPGEPKKSAAEEAPDMISKHSQAPQSDKLAADPTVGKISAPVSERPPAEIQPVAQIEPPAVQIEVSEAAPVQPSISDSSAGRLLALGCIVFGVSGALFLLYKSLPARAKPDAPPRRYVRPPLRRAGSREICADEFELVTGDVPVSGKRCEPFRDLQSARRN